MNDNNMNQQAMQNLLKMASKKLGIPEEKLQSALESGSVEDFAENLKAEDKEKLKNIMQKPNLDEQITNNPQVKEILKKLDD